jgi:hypothetical protein
MPFDLNNPPEVPPPGVDPAQWRDAYAEYRKHQPNLYGRCTLLVCAERFPCTGHQLALRRLIELYAPKTQALPAMQHIGMRAMCRWCDESIELTAWGWLHDDGFILCQRPKPGMPPLTRAEPG